MNNFNITPPKPLSSDELIKLVDEKYDNALKSFDASFVTAYNPGNIVDQEVLDKLKDKPVLQHIVKLHMQHGASYGLRQDTRQSFANLVFIMNEIKMADQINAAIASTAIKAGNFQGDMIKAFEFSGPGN